MHYLCTDILVKELFLKVQLKRIIDIERNKEKIVHTSHYSLKNILFFV